MNNLALLLLNQGECKEAVVLFRQSLSAREMKGVSSESSHVVVNLADSLVMLGELEQAEELLLKNIPVFTKHLSENHLFIKNLKGMLAKARLELGRADEALPELQFLINGRRTTYPNGSWCLKDSSVCILSDAPVILSSLSYLASSSADRLR
jgi:tetratricopeptide (TPR) repeat protein